MREKGNPHMNLIKSLSKQLDDATLSRDERARLRCQMAADLEHRGQYEAACNALDGLWQGAGRRPALAGLSEHIAAEVLLRAGTLSACLGSAGQSAEIQSTAKDFISESATRFAALNEKKKAAIARSELAICYWREGAFDEARVLLTDALPIFDESEAEDKAKTLIRLTLVEISSGRYRDALYILTENAPLFEGSGSDALKGRFHGQLALVLKKIGTTERRQDYIDQAILEYTAAIFHFEQAGNTRYRAIDENNLGSLLYKIGRYEEAGAHLKLARSLFSTVKDTGRTAQVDETRACVLLAQGKPHEAESVIRGAVRILSRGGEQGLLAEALTTQGRVLARLGNFPESRGTLQRAADLAESAGAVEDAGRALLTLIEEHAERLDERELLEAYDRADSLLKGTQDGETVKRLRACARQIVKTQRAHLPQRRVRSLVDSWANFDLAAKVHAYEARYIKRALIDAKGSVTRAARLLGMHYATLAATLDEKEGRHKDLAHLRTPPEPRRQSVIPAGRRCQRRELKSQTAVILHAEDSAPVADVVKETLEHKGWTVETCTEGAQAMRRIEGKERYDLLILDNDLGSGADGIELVRRARQLPHRRRTPIIMLSASDVEPGAWRAGVDAFLKKPQDMDKLTAMVTRLLSKK